MVETIAQAIATFEGFFKAGTLAQRNNNPGNLRSWGSAPIRDGYAHFETAEDGWKALYRQIELNISRGLSLSEFFGGKAGVYPGYAPAADANDPNGYARFVATRTGLPVDVPIQTALSFGSGAATVLSASTGASPVWRSPDSEGFDVSPGLLVAGGILAAAVLYVIIS